MTRSNVPHPVTCGPREVVFDCLTDLDLEPMVDLPAKGRGRLAAIGSPAETSTQTFEPRLAP